MILYVEKNGVRISGFMVDFKNKNVTIFGLGRSGFASAKKLALSGAKVFATEAAASIDAGKAALLKDLGVQLELGGHTEAALKNAELIVVSPGIHLDIPLLEEAKARKIPIISEIELAYYFITKPIIAITGTNGKTTTTTLIGEMLKAGGKKVAVAGNLGFPLVEVDDASLDYVAAEISSYQLEAMDKFKPYISVILNIQPDHFERHHTMEEYIRQKARIFINQTGDDYVVFNQDDSYVSKMVEKAKARLIGFSKDHPEIITLPPEQIKIPGKHNLENALAAAQTAYLCGVDKNTVAKVLKEFPGVEHRIEYVTTLKGVEFYNDSKATNPDSTLAAIETFAGRGIILILGGREKGVALHDLAEKTKRYVKEVVLIGEAADKFESALSEVGHNAIHRAGSMEAAVRKSFSLAKNKDVVLFSPACASFDMFNDFEERGRSFKEACLKLN